MMTLVVLTVLAICIIDPATASEFMISCEAAPDYEVAARDNACSIVVLKERLKG